MSEEKEKKDWSKLEIGALWKKEGRDQNYYSGYVKIDGKEQEVICFANKHKTEDKHPDIRVYISEPKS